MDLAQEFPNNALTYGQVYQKLYDIWGRLSRPEYTKQGIKALFEYGRSTVDIHGSRGTHRLGHRDTGAHSNQANSLINETALEGEDNSGEPGNIIRYALQQRI